MWGQEAFCRHQHECHGIIPTRVGTSGTTDPNVCSVKDHPHACGDKTVTRRPYQVRAGSSPRVWGQAHSKHAVTRIVGIIPTRVGTSFVISSRVRKSQDHPHACGDKCLPLGTLTKMTGSSPRVWGQAAIHNCAYPPFGIIPTRVGTS